MQLDGVAVGDRFPEHNTIWYLVKDSGFVHSSAVQPVRNEPNKPYYGIPYKGMLMEVTVPYIDAYWKPKSTADLAYRYYYGSTFWVNGISQDVNEHKWYRILDDKWDYRYYAHAEAFRPIAVSELTPISPQVPASGQAHRSRPGQPVDRVLRGLGSGLHHQDLVRAARRGWIVLDTPGRLHDLPQAPVTPHGGRQSGNGL